MLTKVTAYSQWATAAPLVFNVVERPDTDLFEVRNIDGLEAVKADVNTTPMGSIDKEIFTGSNVGKRNIVITIGLNPDWNNWTFSSLRRLLDKYFMPKQKIRLVFETTEFSPVEISGYVEANNPNMFSKDPEHQISIICPDPYFIGTDPVILTGLSSDGTTPLVIDYKGSVETGINVTLTSLSEPDPASINVQIGDPDVTQFLVFATVDSSMYFLMNSLPGQKSVENIAIGSGVITDLLIHVQPGSEWPILQPGTNDFSVIVTEYNPFDPAAGHQEWELTYFELFGSL